MVSVGDTVSEVQLQLLMGSGAHPVTGEILGRAYPGDPLRRSTDR